MDAYATLQAQRPMINVAALVGHANLRLAAMRDPSAQPTADEQRAMERMLDASLAAGAVGFSTGLAYQPGGMARAAELEGLARVAARGALHTSHIRNEGDTVEESVDEVLSIGRQSGCATVLSHHKCMMPRNWGKSRATLANIDRARAEGVDVALDIYPYPGSSTILIRSAPSRSTTSASPGRRRIPSARAATWPTSPPTGVRQDRGRAPALSGRRDLFRHGRERGAPHLPA